MVKKKNDFTGDLEDIMNIRNEEEEIKEEIKETNEDKIETKKLVIKPKIIDKVKKVSFPLYLEDFKVKELDRICKKTGYSRNELINMFIDYCLNNYEFEK